MSTGAVESGEVGTEVAEPVLIVEHGEDGRCTLVLNDLRKRNALSDALAQAVAEAIDGLTEATKLIVLRSGGPVFCSGADLKGSGSGVYDILRTIARSPVPIVAEVSGPALGAGVSVVAFATYALIAEEAWCSLPEVEKLGRFPRGVAAELCGFSGMRLLTDVAVTGRRLPGAEVVAAGWATSSHPAAEFGTATEAFVEGLLRQPREVLVQLQESWRGWLSRIGATTALFEGH